MQPPKRFATLALTLCLACSVTQAGTEIDIPTAKRLSLVLLSNGQPKAARDILTTLNAHSPDDVEILISLSRAQRALGQNQQAIENGRKAFRMSHTKTMRYLSARTLAEALASDGHHTRAQIWLRRAGQNAPNEVTQQAIKRDYHYVRSRNPWAFSFGGSITPTDNANDAPTSDELVIGGLVFVDPTARPIPGVEYSFSAKAIYRLPATAGRQTQLSLGYDAVRVRLGSEAAQINPDLRDEDFSFDRVTLGWGGKFKRPDSADVLDASARVFHDWNGGSRSQNGQALAAGYSWNMADHQVFRLGAEAENLDRIDRPLRSSTTYRLSAKWSATLGNSDRFGLGLTFSDTHSDSFAVAHKSARLRASYQFSEPVMSAQIGLAADFRKSLFDTPLYSPERRADDGLTVTATATFSELSIYGFAPVLELQHQRVRSNVARFDRQSTQLSISFRSTY